jgi:hypothetical protein
MSAPFLPLLLIFGGIAAIAGGGGSATSSSSSPQGQPRPQQTSGGITWHDGRGSKLTNQQRRENYDAVYLMGKVLEDAGYFGEGFADWLRVVSFTEARGNPAAGSDAFSNAARGMFGFRPTTAWNETPTHNGVPRQWDEASAQIAFNNGAVTAAEVAALKDLPWSVALAAHNVSRLRKYTQGGPYTMLGARRGWAYPSLVPDHDNSQRPELLERWGEALAYFGLPASFGSQPMDVLVSRSNFPHPAQLRELIMAASLGTGTEEGADVAKVPGTLESGTYGGKLGNLYAWGLAQLVEGPWAWAVDMYDPEGGVVIASDWGEVNSRNLAAQAVNAAVSSWENTI